MFNPFRKRQLEQQLAKQRGEYQYNLPDPANGVNYLGKASRGASFRPVKTPKYQLPDDVLDYDTVCVSRIRRLRGRKLG